MHGLTCPVVRDISVPRPEIEATPLVLEGQVLIPEPPGTSQFPHKVNDNLI